MQQSQEKTQEKEDDVYPNLTIEACLAKRDVLGGTALPQIQQAIAAKKAR